MKKRIVFLFLILPLLLFFSFVTAAYSGQATLSWDAPTTNADGTPLTDLDGYKVYYGTSSGNYTNNIRVGNVTIYTVTNLPDGVTFYFVVTAYDTSDNESGYSNEVSKTISGGTQYALTVNKTGAGTGTVFTSSQISINSFDSQQLPGYPATAAIDGNAATFWTYKFDPVSARTPHPHYIALDLGNSYTVEGLRYLPRQDGSLYGTITRYEGYVSENPQDWGTAVKTGTFASDSTLKEIAFTGKLGRYVKLVSLADAMNSVGVAAAEINVLVPAGTVSSSPAGISCGTDCSETYNAGTMVTLTASTDVSLIFTGWSGGGCSGTGTCNVTMDAAKTVTATFALNNTYTLTVSNTGTGTGTITSSPAGISCGTDCTEIYNSGTSITLTALPTANSTFTGWSGVCFGTGTICNVTMDATKAVTAAFTANAVTYTITASTGTGGTISPSGATTVNYGANQTFTITPNTGYYIASVTVDGSSIGGVTSYTFTNVTANHTINSNFAALRYLLWHNPPSMIARLWYLDGSDNYLGFKDYPLEAGEVPTGFSMNANGGTLTTYISSITTTRLRKLDTNYNLTGYMKNYVSSWTGKGHALNKLLWHYATTNVSRLWTAMDGNYNWISYKDYTLPSGLPTGYCNTGGGTGAIISYYSATNNTRLQHLDASYNLTNSTSWTTSWILKGCAASRLLWYSPTIYLTRLWTTNASDSWTSYKDFPASSASLVPISYSIFGQ